jgi:hypothetical protein
MSRLAAVFVQLHSAVEVDARIEALEAAANVPSRKWTS